MIKQRLLPCLALTLWLAGCAGTPPQQTHSQSFQVQRWQADGKIGLKYPRCDQYRGCKNEAVNAAYVWTHTPQSNTVQFFDPTGQEQLALTYQGGAVKIRENGREERMSIAALTQKLGITLPVEQLNHWLTEHRTDNEWQSDGWHIRASDWQGHFYRKLTLTRGDYRLRLITNQIKSTD